MARHVIQCILNYRFLSEMTSYDVASNIGQALAVGVTGDVGSPAAAR